MISPLLILSTLFIFSSVQPLSPPSPPPPQSSGCMSILPSFSPCLPYVASVQNNMSAKVSSLCCNVFWTIFESDSSCLCYLLQQPHPLGIPLNPARIRALSSVCPARNATAAMNTTIELICLASPTLPPLRGVTQARVLPNSTDSNQLNESTDTDFTIIDRGGIYDFYQLVMQYQPNVCVGLNKNGTPNNCVKTPIMPKFTMHGLWPTNYTNNSLGCYGNGIDISVVNDPVRNNELQKIWPNLLGDDMLFWKYEWETHGTCVQQVMTQEQYFNYALFNALMLEYMFGLDHLKASGASVDEISLSIKIFELTNAVPQFRCIKRAIDNDIILAEIVICLKQGIHNPQIYQDCPMWTGNCPPVFTF